jgi:hypothetical protein
MPALVTKTIRIRLDQELDILMKYKGTSSALFRSLYDIFEKSETPGMEIIKLRKKLKEVVNGVDKAEIAG